MNTHDQALQHSPTLWGLAAIGVASTIGAIGIVVWNVWEHRADVRSWLKL